MQSVISEAHEHSQAARGGWSFKRLAQHWDVHVRTIRRRVEAGELDVFYVGGVPRVTDESRVRVENARARQPEAAAA